jgi:septum formation protein
MLSSKTGPIAKTGIILASASQTRARLLQQAGLNFDVRPEGVDEGAVCRAMRAEGAGVADVALTLAKLKAVRASAKAGNAFVIGADQMLDCLGVWYSKAQDLVEAEQHLRALRGQTHQLISAVVVARDGAEIWRHHASARLTMRDFSDDFLEQYLASVGPGGLAGVGCYQIEGRGIQLFSKIEGDFFTILGLPLMELLAFLRQHGAISR